MAVHPILVDSCPEYLSSQSRTASLLLAPIGTELLVHHLSRKLRAVTPFPPAVIPTFQATAAYTKKIVAAAPDVRVLANQGEIPNTLTSLDPSDALLLVDPRTFSYDNFDLQLLLKARPDPRWAVHYVVAGSDSADPREYAEIDSTGRVRCVRRCYDRVTWPFIAGVAASVLPVSALGGELFDDISLTSLRARLATRGVAAHDLPLQAATIDLSREAGLLALMAAHLRRTVSADRVWRPVLVGGHQRIHATARFVGPVVLHPDVVVHEHAVLMGPTIIGPGAQVGRQAIVAQALVDGGCVIGDGALVHNRAVFDNVPGRAVTTAARACGDDVHVTAERSRDEYAPHSRYMAVKRVAETLIAALVTLVLSPLMLLVALAIALDSDGPIVYAHEREGLHGRSFRCLKFRSMHVGAERLQRELQSRSAVDGPQFKVVDDPRVTRVGRLLRRTNLDELPQLINVIRGEMALVGPRPSPFTENQLCVPWRQGRLSVRPGITGLWQVCRHDRANGDFEQWIEYDLLYARHISPMLDFRIALATVLTAGGQLPVPVDRMLPATTATKSRARHAAAM